MEVEMISLREAVGPTIDINPVGIIGRASDRWL